MRRNLIEETQLTAETKDVDEESGAGARVFNSGAERRKEENPKGGIYIGQLPPSMTAALVLPALTSGSL